MSLTRTSVMRPIGTSMLYLAVIVLGYTALQRLAVDLMPSVDFPRISIVTSYSGVGPEEMETLITRPIERSVSTIEGIESIESVSGEGISRVQLQFGWGTDLDVAVNDTRAFLDRLANTLPEGADRPVVHKFDISAFPIAYVGVSGSSDPRRLRYLSEQTISRRLERVPGIAAVNVRGGQVREIRLELDADRLVALELSAREVNAALSRDNRNVSAGDMLDAGREVVVRTVGEWEDVEQIEGVLIGYREGRPIYVRDVATVRDTFQEIKSEQWIDGEPGIRLQITKQSGVNTIEVVKRLYEEVEAINAEYGERLQLKVLWDSGAFIESSVTNVQNSALVGAALAVLVLLFFLRDIRATLVIATAIPISVIATFGLMDAAGYSLNVISFGGLALGIGMLVDNAIVILENIYRKREEGLSGLDASVEGAREVAPAVIAGTLTTVAVFAPVIFIGGFAGIFFAEMAAVVSFALLCSLAVAVTLVPMIAARVIKPPGRGRSAWARLLRAVEGAFNAVEAFYGRVVGRAVRSPWLVVTVSFLALVASARLVPLVGFELMPETDEGLINVDVELPVGTPIEKTRGVIRGLEQRVLGAMQPGEVKNTLSSAGPKNWWRPGGSNEGEIELTLVPVSQRARGIEAILVDVRKATGGVPGARMRIRRRNSNVLDRLMRGRSGERLTVEIYGHEVETADRLAEQVRQLMLTVDGVADAKVEREEGQVERAIHVDPARAADLGLARADVAETIETYVLGRVATRYRDAGDEFDVRVQLKEADRRAVDQLGDLPIPSPRGGTVPLSSVAVVKGRRSPASISRVGQERVTTVTGGLGERPLDEVVAELDGKLKELSVPRGFTVAIGGEQAAQQDTFNNLLVGIFLAIFLVFMVMAVQFESIRHPMVIMVAVPFGFIGVILSLVLTGTTFNMNSFLGSIVLVGIVVNNAIVLVDTINLLRREQHLPLLEAIQDAARRRLRPILMTTSTTVLAMLPLASGLGEGSEIQAPMARVIVGGLLTSTAVTLILVPCLYVLMERRGERLARQALAAAVSPGAERA